MKEAERDQSIDKTEESIKALTQKYIGSESLDKISAHQVIANLETQDADELRLQLATQTATSSFLSEVTLDNLKLSLLTL